jgi:hypothetical protein
MDKDKELTIKVLEIGMKYGQATQPIRIEVGIYMTSDRRIKKYPRKRRKKKKSL